MKKKIGIFTLLLALMIPAWARSAEALTIDLRGGAWSAANFQPSYSQIIGGLGVTLNAMPTGATLYQDSVDGVGVRYSYEVDEIENSERLNISFSSVVTLDTIYISDLFYESRPNCGYYYEQGSYSLDGSTWVNFTANHPTYSGPNGEIYLAVGAATSEVWFKAPGKISKSAGHCKTCVEDHEFSVQKLKVSVPEPGTWLLLLTGFASLAVFTRLRKAA